MSQDILQTAKQSMKENHGLLSSLGNEGKVKIKHHEDEDVFEQLSKYLPKSSEGKTVLAIAIAAIAWQLLKK